MSAVNAPFEQAQQWIDRISRKGADPSERAESRETHNGAATASYLFGILSPLPLLGLLFGVAAVVEGAQGLRHARRHPAAGGVLQSRIGIALGGFFATLYAVACLSLIVLWF